MQLVTAISRKDLLTVFLQAFLPRENIERFYYSSHATSFSISNTIYLSMDSGI
jgi:hypothetical protein